MNNRILQFALIAFAFALPHAARAQDDQLQQRAEQLAQDALIVDTHIDMPYRVYDDWADVSGAVPGNGFDAPRARAGGLDVAFMSIFVPAELQGTPEAAALADRLIDLVEAQVARAPGTFAIARSADEAERLAADGKIALPLGMENGAPIAGDLDKLRHFHRRGIRYITLTHGKANHISDSSYDPVPMWQGLSPFGAKLVGEMNRLGIMVDVSHISDQAFFDVIEITSAPVVATHSSARHFTPGFERNASDEIIEAIGENGGVVMINFGSAFLTAEANEWQQKFSAARENFMGQLGTADRDDPRIEAFSETYREANPFPYADVGNVADHIEHVIEIAGIDHVGIGSDYDGVGDSLPEGLKDVSTFPNLIAELLRRGRSEADVRKILGGNLMRVWREVEAAA
ncbi:MAG: dipeptidase, partial [Wenzhouxiangellaceae bacterium]|nr:dipeptidase [Wenzhouxiangellaceae bacterium]